MIITDNPFVSSAKLHIFTLDKYSFVMDKLNVGDKAPDFIANDQNGNKLTLADFKGRRLVLYFYPKDNTPGCTAEACSLRDGRGELEKMGFTIIGVSPDSEKSHQGFAAKHNLGFTLLADPDKTIAKAYGAWGPKKFMGREYEGILRKTFIIDAEGRIEKIFNKVDTKRHFEQIADSYK